MRLVVDMVEFCARDASVPPDLDLRVHIREAGSTAAQELAFTLADGFAYVEAAVEGGLDVDDFAPRLSFFFNASSRLLRGDREVPSCAEDLGARDARPLRRAASARC